VRIMTHHLKKLRIGFPLLVCAMAGIQTASASLILETFQEFSGTGLGTVPTIVTFQSNGFETGCVGQSGVVGSALVAGVCSSGGDTKTGNSQSQLQPLSAAGITTGAAGAANFGLIYNAVQPAGGPLTVTDIRVAFYSSAGAFLYQTSGLFCEGSAGGPVVPSGSGCLLTFTQQGTGNSGFLVTLDAAQQAAAVAAGAFSSTSNLVGASSAAGTTGAPSAGGSETIFLANAGAAPPQAIPEPITLFLSGAGLLGLVFLRRRVNSR